MSTSTNPLLSDRDVDFLLYEVHDAQSLFALDAFREHSRETADLFLASVRRFARERVFPAYRATEDEPPTFRDGRMFVHPAMHALYPQMAEMGLISAPRTPEHGGLGMPFTLFVAASAYVMAASTAIYGWIGLTSGAAHLIESFGTDELRERFMRPMYEGRWTGTMALTEPHAGSSVGDARTRATPAGDGSYRIEGTKIFISGGDNDFAENVVHLTLARIDGAAPGTRGLSLFAVPRLRPEGDALVDNDVHVAGAIHKLGWKCLPSVVLNYGERGDCRGWLVGEAGRGMAAMFQMMNEARIMVGLDAVATAAVAYHESVEYARTRPQGRGLAERDASRPQVPIIEHADVRRMLLRQKAIAEGGLSLALFTSLQADLVAHAETPEARGRAKLLLDLLTPVTKSFPAEKGFESNALALQVHGGYGYSSEYLVGHWLRDQKLNSIHEGTTGIQSLDLLGRKAVAGGGASLLALKGEIDAACARAREAGVEGAWCDALARGVDAVASVTMELGAAGLAGDSERMLAHSVDYLEMVSLVVIGWQWLLQAAAAKAGLARGGVDADFYAGKLRAAQYWVNTELSRVAQLAALCQSGEDSYLGMKPEWF